MILGSMFGACYSFNFTNRRIEYFQAMNKVRLEKMSKHLLWRPKEGTAIYHYFCYIMII